MAALIAAAALAGAARPPTAPSVATSHRRADAAIQSFLLKFWSPSRNYLNAAYPSNGRLTGYWTYANGWQAVIGNVERTHSRMYEGWIEAFYNGQNARGWSANYYDDENWMVLALLHANAVTHDPRYLDQAEALYADIEGGWDTSCCGSGPGGIWWDKAHTQKATASNAGPVISACQLYTATRKPAYLSFAEQVYDYWWEHMVNPTSYQVADHINPDGRVVWWKFTYNEGLMIGAGRELYRVTHQARYLTNADRVAGFMIQSEIEATRCGPVLFDGTNRTCKGDAQQFKGVAYHSLTDLYAASPQRRYSDVLQGSADSIWELARNPLLDLFAADWAGPPPSSVSEQQENAAAIALCDFARTRGSYPGSGIASNQYEAEDAALHSLGPENTRSGFTGWGYVAGWNADGQWVEFHPTMTAGSHKLTFRYAAGAGDAMRLIAINGRPAFPSQKFPATGSWESYRRVSVSSDFPAGRSRVLVSYSSSQGSVNELHVDNLVVN